MRGEGREEDHGDKKGQQLGDERRGGTQIKTTRKRTRKKRRMNDR